MSVFATGEPSDAAEPLQKLVNEFNKARSSETQKLKGALSGKRPFDASEYSEEYKKLLFSLHGAYVERILGTPSHSKLNKKEQELEAFFRSALERLEFKEKEVDSGSEKVKNHVLLLESKKFRFRGRFFFETISWQSEATLQGPFESTRLLTTNIGFCPGLGGGLENRFWSVTLDLCGLYGTGGVSAIQGLVEYQQSSVPAFGGKLSLGLARVVAANGSELGLHGNLLFVRQNLASPSDSQYQIQQNKTLGGSVTLFSRWRLGSFHFQTDFGRMIGRPATVWSLGVGVQI